MGKTGDFGKNGTFSHFQDSLGACHAEVSGKFEFVQQIEIFPYKNWSKQIFPIIVPMS